MSEFDDLNRKTIVYQLPQMDQVPVRKDITYKSVGGVDLKLDIYYPLNAQPQQPAVLLVHGGSLPEHVAHVREMGLYTSWGRLLAASGQLAVMFQHRSDEFYSKLQEAASDVDDLVAFVRAHGAELGIDPDALCIFAFSSGPLLGLRSALKGTPEYIRCIVTYYGGMTIMNPKYFHFNPEDELVKDCSPVYHLAHEDDTKIPPLFIARAGRDREFVNDSIDEFVSIACQRNLPITLINHPHGAHGFDVENDDPRAREIIRCTLEFLHEHLNRRS